MESSPVPEDFVFFLGVPTTRQVFDVYDILVGDVAHFAELEKHEGAGADRVTTVEWKNAQRDIMTLR